MRESLTVLAILLIVVLTTALVGPYFVDWNAHRGEIETRLSTLVGAKVAVTGPIDVKLLPRPIFRLQDVTVAGHSPQEITATAARVDMELSLTALLRGDILFVEADITAPTVIVPLAADRTVVLPRLGDATADRISLVHLAIHDGTVLVRWADGKPAFTLSGIGGDGEADSLAGPFKFSGTLDTVRGALPLRLATGSIDGSRLRLKLGLDAAAGVPKTDLDGILTFAPGSTGATAVGFDGSLSASGTRPLAGRSDGIPWRLTTPLHADATQATLGEGELRAGADGRALIAVTTGTVDLSASPRASLALHARQADLGRLVVPADPAAAPEPGQSAPVADTLAALGAMASDTDLLAGLPLPLALDYGIDTVSLGQFALARLTGHVALQAGRPVMGTLSVATPDDSSVAFDGSFEPGTAAVFKGRVTASTNHLRRLADSLVPDLPAAAAAIRQALPVDALQASGSIDISGVGFAGHDLVLALDRSRLAGTVTLTRAVGADPARLFAALTSDALDLDALQDWRDTARAAADLDVVLTLSAQALRVGAGDTGSLNAGRIALDLKKSGRVVTLDRLSLADIGGATAELRGRSDGSAAHIEGRLDARRLHDLFALADRLVPGSIADLLAARADALSPAILAVAGDAAIGADGTLSPTLLTLDGTAAATRLSLHLTPGRDAAATAVPPPFDLALTLDAPDSGALLRQIGLGIAPASAVGRAHLEAKAQREAAGQLTASLQASLGDTTLSADGRGDPAGRLTGRLSAKSGNLAPLARALQVATPEAGAAWPGEVSGAFGLRDGTVSADGVSGKVAGTPFKGQLVYRATVAGATQPALTGSLTIDQLPLVLLMAPVLGPLPAAKPGAVWPDTPFAPALLTVPRSEVALTVPSLPLPGPEAARDVHAVLRLAPGLLTLADVSARIGGDGRIGGTVTLRRDGAAASLAGHGEWSGLPLASPAIGGLSRGSLDLAGTGTSLAAIMASLAGTGSLEIADARLPRFDPTGISRTIAGTDAAATTLDAAAIGDDLGRELDRAALSLGTVTAPLTVAAGTARSDGVRIDGPLVASETSGALDLRGLLLTLKSTARLRNPPKDWVGAAPQASITWKGPFAAPAREVDAGTLVNGIAARAIARDQERIEDFQDDIRERAFFARRLKAIEAEQQAARDKARAAEAEANRQRLQQLIQGIPLPPVEGPAPLDLRPPSPPMPTPRPRPGAPARP